LYKPGIIERITGPVVVAHDMLGAQMYELVKVGEIGLIGEVVRLEGERATVQVYEETAGIKPGEHVERTGKPLSVELGPGMINQIYDGIQRPLPTLREIAGTFITRGVSSPALDRKKTWRFVPKVKVGQKVTGGDILGEVSESVLVTQRILVPPNVAGSVKTIEKESEYRVTDDVAEVDTQNGLVKLQLMHTWPVRKARPVKSRLSSVVPLVTGQRIMDFLFPIAKGGTAAIPGGFGTGKCIAPDTTILLADGRLVEIEELFEECQLNGKVSIGDGGMEHTVVSESMPRIVTLSDESFKTVAPSFLYSSVSPRMVELTTRTGRRIKTTPEHKFRILSPDLTLALKPAAELTPGDRVLVPRRIDIRGKRTPITAFGLLPDEDLKLLYVADRKTRHAVASLLTLHKDTYPRVAAKLGTNTMKVFRYAREYDSPPLCLVKRLLEFSAIKPNSFPIRRIKGKSTRNSVHVPKRMSPQLAELLGLFVTDGTLRPTYVGFRNHDRVVLTRFKKLAETIFRVRGRFCAEGREYRIYNIAAVRLVSALAEHKIGEPKYSTVKVPTLVQVGDQDIVRSFLRGVFHGDGSLGTRDELSIPTDSKTFANGLAYLLLRLGIFHRIEERKLGGKVRFRVWVQGKKQLVEFTKAIRPLPYAKRTRLLHRLLKRTRRWKTNYLDSIPIKKELLREILDDSGLALDKLQRKGGVYYWTYLESGRIPPLRLKRLLAIIEQERADCRYLSRIKEILRLSESIVFDEVKSVRLHEKPQPVYDFTVPITHNFVAGFGGVVGSNTVMQQQLAKWADAEIIVYVGCGERGNEMTEVLETFPELKDPRSGQPLMARTILVANTSNMPIAAREASVYTGITMAEYFRDMGYDVALMADSTSRWAEALREISGRLEEMPGEEGYPAYLASKLAEFYERAGRVELLGSESRDGSISAVGAVSPSGGDFSEPVTQNTLRITKVFWALSKSLAERRHFPAIDWLTSYSLYLDSVEEWYEQKTKQPWRNLRRDAMSLLQRDEELREIVMLVGPDALSEGQRATLEAARMIKEDFLIQSALHPVDSYCSPEKTTDMIRLILNFHKKMERAVEDGVSLQRILDLPVRQEIGRCKIEPSERFGEVAKRIEGNLDDQFSKLAAETRGPEAP